MREAHVDLDPAIDAFRTKPDCRREAIAFLRNLVDVDTEHLPCLMHPMPKLSEPFFTAIDRIEIGPDTGCLELRIRMESLEPRVEIAAAPGNVTGPDHFQILRHRGAQCPR